MPADQIERLPFFGRTWYVHGVEYWFRRAMAVLLALIGLAVACRVEVALFNLADTIGSQTGRWAFRTVWAVLLIASLIAPARALLTVTRRHRNQQLLRPDWQPGATTRTGGGPALAASTGAGNTLGAATLFLGIVTFFGWFLVIVIFTLQPEYGIEHDARLRLQHHT